MDKSICCLSHWPVLWLSDTHQFNDAKRIRQSLASVSAERREKILKYKFIKDQALSLVAGLMLEAGLNNYHSSASDDHALYYNEFGKPYLRDQSLYFNLSHSESLVLAIFSSSEVGCDIECLSGADNAIVDRCFSCHEKQLYYDSDKAIQEQIFFRIWTLREAFLKAIGTGLFHSVPDFSVVSGDGLFVPMMTYHHRRFIGQSDIYQNYAYAWWMEN